MGTFSEVEQSTWNLGTNTSYQPFQNPYLDLTSLYHPSTVKELLSLAKTWFYGHPMVSAVVSKYAEYAVTSLIYNDSNEELCDKWKHYLEKILDILAYSIHAGLNYFALGNHIMSVRFPTRRKFICTSCLNEQWEENTDWGYKFPYFSMKCRMCSGKQRATALDVPIKNFKRISLISWNPKDIFISFTQEFPEKSKYYFRVPPEIKRKIMLGYKHQITGVPVLYIEAVRKFRLIELNKDNLFHMKAYTIAEPDMAWGKPLAMSVFKKIHYSQILNKAQEAIALDRANPTDIFFPQATAGLDPIKMLNLTNWQTKVREQLKKARRDITYKAIMPGPIGAQRLGGDAKALLLTPELDNCNREIAGGMRCPPEMVFGGLNWSGSSVSLRMLENSFKIYRNQLIGMIDWIVDRLSPYLGIPPVKLKFSEFKMADDPQQKQIAIQLYTMGILSAKTMLGQWGWDWEDELKQRASEETNRSEYQERNAEIQAKLQGRQMILTSRFQAQAQLEANQVMEAGSKDAVYGKAKQKVEALMRQQGNRRPKVDEIINNLSRYILKIPDQQFAQAFLEALRERSPSLATMVEMRIEEMQQGGGQQMMPPGMMPGMMPPGMMPPGQGPQGQMPQEQMMPPGSFQQQMPPGSDQGNIMSPIPNQRPPRRDGVNA